MEYYLTDTIYIKNNEMFSIVNHKHKPLKKYNWHLYLYDYGWRKLPKKWISKINQLSDTTEKNSLFGILDVPHDGDCFFHCFAYIMNEKNNYLTDYTSNDIRKMISDSINEETYLTMIHYYRIMKNANDFDENWNPHEIHTFEDYQKQLNISGNHYWADSLLLQHITQFFKINLIILQSDSTVYNTLLDFNKDYDTFIIMLDIDLQHFQLVGYFNGKCMISYIHSNSISSKILKYFL